MLDSEKFVDLAGRRGVDRRTFLAYSAGLAALPALGARAAAAQGALAKPSFASNPFSLGVASGDPAPTGVVLWTRLAPKPLEADGGMKPEPVEVVWEVATDEGLKNVVARGSEIAGPQR